MSNPVPRLRRLLSIIPLIQRRGAQGISLQELQDTLGVSKKELLGDLNAILLCGVPPYLPNDYISVLIENGHVTVDYADHFARPARLTLREALALRLAIERLSLPEDGPLYDAAIELQEVIDRLVRKLGQGSMAALEGRIEAARAQDTGSKLSVIGQAIAERRALVLTYYTASREDVTAGRRVLPYGHGDKGGNHYLFAWDDARADQRTFRLDRISRLEAVGPGGAFEVPGDFDLPARLERVGPSQPFPLRLRIAEEIARFVADDHAELRVERTSGGDVVVEIPCGSIPWAVSKALLYGELAEVLEPQEARDALCRRLRDFLDAPAAPA